MIILTLTFTPDQVDVLVEWLNDLKTENGGTQELAT